MHMSSVWSGNTGGQIGFFAPGEGKIHDIVLSLNGRGWGNCKFCKIADGKHRDLYHGDESQKGFYKMRSITSFKS